jgi:signal transduction histidine kinase
MSDDYKALLFRSIRELLVNAVKHGKPKHIGVSIQRDGNNVCVWVEDDGVGFDPKILDSSGRDMGFGLFSIRERLEQRGGSLVLESGPGQGCQALVTAPIDML